MGKKYKIVEETWSFEGFSDDEMKSLNISSAPININCAGAVDEEKQKQKQLEVKEVADKQAKEDAEKQAKAKKEQDAADAEKAKKEQDAADAKKAQEEEKAKQECAKVCRCFLSFTSPS